MADASLFIKDQWYLAFHASFLSDKKLVSKEILGEPIVFGREANGKVFALRDNCPHRGVPLSDGWFDGSTIQCCYHGWKFNCTGTCTSIPAIDPSSKVNVSKIKVFQYPVREINYTIWVYIPEKKLPNLVPKAEPPNLLLGSKKNFCM
jgi:phenylpropionate dioxygenase-like ring-hydroxylating dioxygenase large terminal subunit